MVKKYKINLANVWKRYPNPVSAAGEGKYCVGGALCQYAKRYLHFKPLESVSLMLFPAIGELTHILKKLNPNLEYDNMGYKYADKIINQNDNYRYKSARKTVAEALNYVKPE